MSLPIVGEYNTTPTTYGSGQKIPIQTDAAGRLLATSTDAGVNAAIGTTADPATAGTNNTSTGTLIANAKSINLAVNSTLPVQTFASDTYVNITTKTTTVVKATPGVLVRIIINKSGVADTLTIYDNTAGSGTIIGTINSPTVGMSFNFNCTCAIGITIVSGGGTAGDYTVIFR